MVWVQVVYQVNSPIPEPLRGSGSLQVVPAELAPCGGVLDLVFTSLADGCCVEFGKVSVFPGLARFGGALVAPGRKSP